MADNPVATFNPTLSDPVSRVRQKIGDKDPAKAKVPDATVRAYLDKYSEIETAARLAEDLAAEFASLVAVTMDHQQTDYSKRFEQYTALAKRLWSEARALGSGSSAGPDGPYSASIIITGGDPSCC